MTTTSALLTDVQFEMGPFKSLVRDYSSAEKANLMLRASRAVETMCNRRLAPFTGLTETEQLFAITVDDQIRPTEPMEQMATLGYSRAASLDTGVLVRHHYLKQYPPLYPDLWLSNTGTSVTSITVYRTFSGSESVDPTTIQYEPDTGHVRFALGTYLPPGSTVAVTYSGGYTVGIPDDLVEATKLMAARLAILELEPTQRPGIDMTELKDEIAEMLIPYIRG
jgi:hypothetical protein